MDEITVKKYCRAGKRERAARKKRFRGSVSYCDKKTGEWLTLKLGHKKMTAFFRKTLESVVDTEKSKRLRALESHRRIDAPLILTPNKE